MGRERPDNDRRERLTVAQAADLLDISEDAVRSRIKRGTVRTEREDGTVWVLLGDQPTRDRTTTGQRPTSELLEAKEEMIALLREQLEREREANQENRRIIFSLTQRVPELEAVTVEQEEDPPATTEGSQAGAQRPWWRFWS